MTIVLLCAAVFVLLAYRHDSRTRGRTKAALADFRRRVRAR